LIRAKKPFGNNAFYLLLAAMNQFRLFLILTSSCAQGTLEGKNEGAGVKAPAGFAKFLTP